MNFFDWWGELSTWQRFGLCFVAAVIIIFLIMSVV